MPAFKDLTGMVFGAWKVMKKEEPDKHGNIRWRLTDGQGNVRISSTNSLLRGKRRADLTNVMRKHDDKTAERLLLRHYRSGAKKRGYTFELQEDFAFKLFSQNCVYCGAPPRLRKEKSGRSITYTCYVNGLDRLDNTRGYEPDNVVPCCTVCNVAKHTMALDDFLAWIARVYEHSIKAP